MKDAEVEHQEIKTEFEGLLARNLIYNVSDFKWLKDRAHRRFSEELGDFMRDNNLCDSGLYYSTPYWNHFNSYIKKVEKNKNIGDEHKQSILKIIGKWEEIVQLSEKAAPLIVKGRKATERKTPPRTLENTGTCAICGKNIKLNGGGRLVNHGYTIQFHQHNGWCFGVNQLPWEVSPQGAVNYINQCLIPTKVRSQESLKILVWSAITLRYIASELREVSSHIAYFEGRIAEWQKQELPRPH